MLEAEVLQQTPSIIRSMSRKDNCWDFGYCGVYQYDGNGNAIYDGRNGYTLSYNMLGMPNTAVGGSVSMAYTYDATGAKIRRSRNGATRDYIDGIDYNGSSIDIIHTETGVARNNSGNYSYEQNLTDHLGNVRYTFNRNPSTLLLQPLQVDSYYAFGLRKSVSSGPNNYLYNGKELQEDSGQLDYGARFYDPVVGRWSAVDPLAEQYRRWSPYNYTMNNPIRFIDPDGMSSATFYEAAAGIAFSQFKHEMGTGSNSTYEEGEEEDKKKKKEKSDKQKFDEKNEELEKQYPKKAGKREKHHIDPQYLGGPKDGELVDIPAPYDQGITNEFRFEWEYGQKKKPEKGELGEIKKKVYDKYPPFDKNGKSVKRAVVTGAKVGTALVVAYGLYQVAKWGVAAVLAPETGGASLLGVAALP